MRRCETPPHRSTADPSPRPTSSFFMKGTKMIAAYAGFRSRVAGVLNLMGVEFQDVNVLADEEIRQGSQGVFRLAHDPQGFT